MPNEAKVVINGIADIREILNKMEAELLGLPKSAAQAKAKPEPKPAPEPVGEPVEGAEQTCEGKIENIYVNLKSKGGKVFKSPHYAIIISGRTLTSLDEKIHDMAVQAKKADNRVCVYYVVVPGTGSTEFYNITNMDVLQD